MRSWMREWVSSYMKSLLAKVDNLISGRNAPEVVRARKPADEPDARSEPSCGP